MAVRANIREVPSILSIAKLTMVGKLYGWLGSMHTGMIKK
jgi:hypothetical protein